MSSGARSPTNGLQPAKTGAKHWDCNRLAGCPLLALLNCARQAQDQSPQDPHTRRSLGFADAGCRRAGQDRRGRRPQTYTIADIRRPNSRGSGGRNPWPRHIRLVSLAHSAKPQPTHRRRPSRRRQPGPTPKEPRRWVVPESAMTPGLPRRCRACSRPESYA